MRNQAIDAMVSLVKVVSRSLNIPASALIDAIREKAMRELGDVPLRPEIPINRRRRGSALFSADWILNGVDAWKRFIAENDIQDKRLHENGVYLVHFLNKTGMIPEVESGVYAPRYEIEFHVREDRGVDITYRPAKFEHKGGMAQRPHRCAVHNIVYADGETCGMCAPSQDRIITPPAPIPVAGTCRACGCTDADCSDCIRLTGQPCTWAEPDLCSACKTLIR